MPHNTDGNDPQGELKAEKFVKNGRRKGQSRGKHIDLGRRSREQERTAATSTVPQQLATTFYYVDFRGDPDTYPTFSAALRAASAGGVIVVSPGDYVESASLELTADDVSVVGAGADVFLTVAAAGGILVARPGARMRIENIVIRTAAADGVLVDAAGALRASAVSHAAEAARLLLGRSLAQDCAVDEPVAAADLSCLTVRAGRCTLLNCRFEHCAHGCAGAIGAGAELLACGCTFDLPRGTAVAARGGARVRVDGCTFDGTQRHGIEAAGGAACAPPRPRRRAPGSPRPRSPAPASTPYAPTSPPPRPDSARRPKARSPAAPCGRRGAASDRPRRAGRPWLARSGRRRDAGSGGRNRAPALAGDGRPRPARRDGPSSLPPSER